MLIQCKPCFAIDVLCALTNRGRSYNSNSAVHRQIVDACKGQKILPDAWALSLACGQNILLQKLSRWGWKQFRKNDPSLMGNSELLHSSIEGVGCALSRLQQSGFEELYKQHCHPYVERWCQALNARLFDLELGGVGRDVQNLFRNPSCQIVTVYLSYFLILPVSVFPVLFWSLLGEWEKNFILFLCCVRSSMSYCMDS